VYLLIVNPRGDKHHEPKELSAFAKEAAKSIKIEKDLGDFSLMLKKVIATVGKQGHRLCAC